MRGPNRRYNCTAGPDGGQCRRCERERIRAVNQYRRPRKLPLLELPELTVEQVAESRRHPCPCEACEGNRERAARRRNGHDETPDAELDRKALERWNPEWGARA